MTNILKLFFKFVFLFFCQDRPAIQLYQPGARSRHRTTGGGADSGSADRKPDSDNKKAADRGED